MTAALLLASADVTLLSMAIRPQGRSWLGVGEGLVTGTMAGQWPLFRASLLFGLAGVTVWRCLKVLRHARRGHTVRASIWFPLLGMALLSVLPYSGPLLAAAALALWGLLSVDGGAGGDTPAGERAAPRRDVAWKSALLLGTCLLSAIISGWLLGQGA